MRYDRIYSHFCCKRIYFYTSYWVKIVAQICIHNYVFIKIFKKYNFYWLPESRNWYCTTISIVISTQQMNLFGLMHFFTSCPSILLWITLSAYFSKSKSGSFVYFSAFKTTNFFILHLCDISIVICSCSIFTITCFS